MFESFHCFLYKTCETIISKNKLERKLHHKSPNPLPCFLFILGDPHHAPIHKALESTTKVFGQGWIHLNGGHSMDSRSPVWWERNGPPNGPGKGKAMMRLILYSVFGFQASFHCVEQQPIPQYPQILNHTYPHLVFQVVPIP